MHTEMIPTNVYYHRILDEADAAARKQLYLDLFVQPWKPMMDMLRMQMPGAADDDLAGARVWNWLLPDQTGQMAALLETLEAADAWAVSAGAIRRAAECFAPYASRIPMDTVTGWLVLGDTSRAQSFERGYTGAVDWTQPRFLGQFWDVNEDNLPRLPGLVAHEMHHLIRLRAFPWGMNTSVADYIIIEGTAEAFAASLFGEQSVGWFITEFEPRGFEDARRLIGANLHATGFDVIRGYIFGDALAEQWGFRAAGGMPNYGGYTIGYQVVKAFLERTGKSIEETTFLPAAEIIEGSGFFEKSAQP